DVRPSGSWRQLDYDDSAWKKGPGGFGRKGTPGSVVRTDWHSNRIWLRKTFTVDSLPTTLALDVHHDDNVQVWLNGTLVFSEGGFLTAYKRVALDAKAVKALKVGENVLVVYCLQTTGGQFIDVGLVADNKVDLLPLVEEHGKAILGEEGLKRFL